MTMEINPLIKNLNPMIIKPSPSSLRSIELPIQIHTIPKDTIIIPAVRSGLNSKFDLSIELPI
jgi:hypothetical protein